VRVLYFTRDYTPHDYRFLSSLAATKHQVFALRLERKGIQKEDRPLPVNVTQVNWKGGRRPVHVGDGLPLLWDLKRVIREIKPDVIHTGPIQTAAFLTALSGFHPQVSMSWGSDLLVDSDRNWFWNRATRLTLSQTSILLGDCQAVKQKAKSLGFDGERVVLFPWGIDLNQYQPGLPSELIKRLGWQDKFILLSLRSWEPIYGVDLVVKAFAKAAMENEDLRLLLLGGGSLAPMVHGLINRYQLADKIYLGGQVKQADLPSFYNSANLYISASHSDGSSVSLMEALACGVPVLVSDIPGNKEWITEGKEGWLFQDGQEPSLNAGILNAYVHRNLAARMSEDARELAKKRANWDTNFGLLLDAYEKAVGNTEKSRKKP
jgi:glycosyltransferase involved in cell wall biosynthesis